MVQPGSVDHLDMLLLTRGAKPLRYHERPAGASCSGNAFQALKGRNAAKGFSPLHT